jgi:uncharacterized protein YjdB
MKKKLFIFICSFIVICFLDVLYVKLTVFAETESEIKWAQTGAEHQSFTKAAYGNGRYVVVGYKRKDYDSYALIKTSLDGYMWQESSIIGQFELDDIIWAGNRFIAVGGEYWNEGSIIVSSTDGINWTKKVLNKQEELQSITWNGKVFVAVGYNGLIYSSSDGLSWTKQSSGTTTYLKDVVWDGKQFIISAYNGFILTSSDGSSWTKRRTDKENGYDDLEALTYGAGKLIGVYLNGYDILVSSDGVNWNDKECIEYSHLNDVTWSGNQFVAVGNYGQILSSSDGEKWAKRISYTGGSLEGVSYSNGKFIAVGNGVILLSSDGINWIRVTPEVIEDLRNVIWTGSKFFVVGDCGTILQSSNGMDWIKVETGTTENLNDIVWNGSKFVAVGDKGTILTSTNGVSWNKQVSNSTDYLEGVTWSGDKFAAIGFYGNVLLSNDGVNWTQKYIGVSGYYRDITYGNSKFVAVEESDGKIATSSDGVNWSNTLAGEEDSWDSEFFAVVWDGKQFIAGGGTIMTSADGMSWSKSSDVGCVYGISSNGSEQIAVTTAGDVYLSKDIVNWTESDVGNNGTLFGAEYNGKEYVVVGVSGTILTGNKGLDEVKVDNIYLDKTNITVEEGKSVILNATITPDNATNKKVTWTSSNSKVATVDLVGKVTAVKASTVVITAATEDGNKTASCSVTVTPKPVAVTGIVLNTNSISIAVGDNSIALTATVIPSNATNKKVTWSSNKTNVAAVDSNGRVTPVGAGMAVVTARTEDGNKTASCSVTVTPKLVSVTGVVLNISNVSMKVGDPAGTLEATVMPGNATNKKVAWSSDHTNVAVVDANGKITPIGAGKAIITARTEDGNKTAKCTVTVVSEKTDFTLMELINDEDTFNNILGKFTFDRIKMIIPQNYFDKIKVTQNDLLRVSNFEVIVSNSKVDTVIIKASNKEYTMNYQGDGLYKFGSYNLPKGCEIIFNACEGDNILESYVQRLRGFEYTSSAVEKTEYTFEEIINDLDLFNKILGGYTLDQIHLVVPLSYIEDIQIKYTPIATALVAIVKDGANRVEFETKINNQTKIFKMQNKGNGRFEGSAAGIQLGSEVKIKVYKDDELVDEIIKRVMK